MKIFDATLFSNKPVLPKSFVAIDHINENYFFDADGLNETKLSAQLARQGTRLVFFDVESAKYSTPEVYMQIARAADRLGTAPFGFYGWPSVPWVGDESDWTFWNDTFAPIVAEVDVIFPCAYATTGDTEVWAKQFDLTMRMAQKYTLKPIYPFLTWMISEKYVGDDLWRFMLNRSRRMAGGCVIWGGGWPLPAWNESASWWRILKDYLKP